MVKDFLIKEVGKLRIKLNKKSTNEEKKKTTEKHFNEFVLIWKISIKSNEF